MNRISHAQKVAESLVPRVLRVVQKQRKLLKMGPSRSVWRFEVTVVGSARMRHLNYEYRGKDKQTDVLSFSVPEPFQSMGMLGELFICLPVLKKQAKERNIPEDLELTVLMVHGLLHLLGFDHELGPKQEKEMARWEQTLLEGLVPQTRRPKAGLAGLITRTR